MKRIKILNKEIIFTSQTEMNRDYVLRSEIEKLLTETWIKSEKQTQETCAEHIEKIAELLDDIDSNKLALTRAAASIRKLGNV
jgi:hypothetical protein